MEKPFVHGLHVDRKGQYTCCLHLPPAAAAQTGSYYTPASQRDLCSDEEWRSQEVL